MQLIFWLLLIDKLRLLNRYRVIPFIRNYRNILWMIFKVLGRGAGLWNAEVGSAIKWTIKAECCLGIPMKVLGQAYGLDLGTVSWLIINYSAASYIFIKWVWNDEKCWNLKMSKILYLGFRWNPCFIIQVYIAIKRFIVEPSYIYLLSIWLILAILNLIFQLSLKMPRLRVTARKRVPVHHPRIIRF